MTETPDVRRNADGAIDFDYYRTQSTALRRQAMRDAATLRMAAAGAVVMAGALGFAIVIPSTYRGRLHDRMAAWSGASLIR